MKKVAKIVSEKTGVKDFFWGNPQRGKAVEKKAVYDMGARVLLARASIMSIFEKSFPMCYFLCTFDDVINFRGSEENRNLDRLCCLSV